MPIINLQPSTPPTPPTVQQLLARKVARIRTRNTQLFQQIIQAVTANMAEVWNDEAITPQQVFDALGTDGGPLVEASSTLCDLINQFAPGTLPTSAPRSLTPGSDGHITVG